VATLCLETCGGESGQALVEAALVLPAMIVLLLCALQLVQLQEARIMAEYAAFSAARTGIVRDMDNGSGKDGADGPMHDAAVLAVLPSFGRTDSLGALAKTLAKFKAQNALLAPLGLSQVRVAVLNPHRGDFARLGGHLNGKELDFDDVRPQATQATLLSLQVRYLYELRVPFANRMIQAIWFASKLARRGPGGLDSWRGWDLAGPKVSSQRGPDAVALSQARSLAAGKLDDGMPGGLNVAGLAVLASRKRYFVPVDAWFTMRMQSNPFLRWAAP
jgi:hypothetical protein